MDQFDYLTREQLLSLLRVLGAARGDDHGHAPGNPNDFPEFGGQARRDFENNSSPMRIFDHETLKYLAVNDAAVKFYGYSREEFLALSLKDTRHPDEHDAQLASLKESRSYFSYGKPRRQLKKSGEIAVVEVVNQDILFNGRKARLALTLDITARLRMQELLWQRQQEFESLAENLPDLIARFDRDHRFVYVNSAVENLSRGSRHNMIGKTQRELGMPDALVTQFELSLDEAIRIGVAHTIEFNYPTPGGERQFEAYHVPERDASGQVATVLCVARDITERKHAELDMQRSAALTQLLETLARAANEAATPEAAMVACLERICRHGRWVIGRVAFYDEGEPRNAPSRSVWHVADRGRFAEFIQISEHLVPSPGGQLVARAMREQTAVWIEDMERGPGFGRRKAALEHGLRSAFAFPVIVRGAVVAVMEFHSEVIRAQDPLSMGAAQSIASQLARIVEREWAHQANARMAAIVESSHDAIVSRTLDGTILTWNPAAERLFGYTAAEIVGRKIEILYPPEIKAEMFRRQGVLLQGLPVQAYETVRVAKDGRRVHVSTSPALIRDSSGNICGVSTIVRDNTERMRAGQALRESEERFRQLAENVDRVFWINTLNLDNNLYVSPAYEKIWGKSCESMRRDPNSWRESIHPEDQPKVREAAARLSGGVHMDVEYRIIRPDGTLRWIRDRSYPMKAGDGTPLVCGIAEDITVQRQAEQERLTHAIRQRDALIREVHHRIKNNLQGVVGLLRQKIRKTPAISPDIEETISQLQSVALVYGLQETRPDGLLNLAEITDAICTSAGNLIGGRLERIFERQSQGPACVVAREAVSVAVALNELVINALKHQPARAGKKHVRIVLRESADEAEIRIANRGQLPAGFDYHGGGAAGNGLELVRTLLAAPGGTLTFNGARGEVEVVLKLAPPLLAERQRPSQGKR